MYTPQQGVVLRVTCFSFVFVFIIMFDDDDGAGGVGPVPRQAAGSVRVSRRAFVGVCRTSAPRFFGVAFDPFVLCSLVALGFLCTPSRDVALDYLFLVCCRVIRCTLK